MTHRILLLEDEQAIADTLLFALRREGFEVQHWQLAREALAAFAAQPPDLAILDVGVPDGNGFDVCRAIRKTSELPIVFLTARSEEIDRILGLELGADDYVSKPFSPREVCAGQGHPAPQCGPRHSYRDSHSHHPSHRNGQRGAGVAAG